MYSVRDRKYSVEAAINVGSRNLTDLTRFETIGNDFDFLI